MINGEMCIVEQSFDLLFNRLAQPLGSAAGELGFATAVAGCRCRACRDPALPRLSRSSNQIDQPFKSVPAIAFPRPETPRHDDENAIGGHPPSGIEWNARVVTGVHHQRRDVQFGK